MPRHFTPQRRAEIVAALHTVQAGRDISRNALARELGCDARSITRIAEQEGLAGLWDTTHTAAATQAAGDRRRARRSVLADALLDDVDRLRKELWQPYTKTLVVGFETQTVVEDTAVVQAARRNVMTSVGIAIDKHVLLDKHDAEDTTETAVDAWLRDVMGREA